jgi:hypothetical protein
MNNDGSVDLGTLYLRICERGVAPYTAELVTEFGATWDVMLAALAELEEKALLVHPDSGFGNRTIWKPNVQPKDRAEALAALHAKGLTIPKELQTRTERLTGSLRRHQSHDGRSHVFTAGGFEYVACTYCGWELIGPELKEETVTDPHALAELLTAERRITVAQADVIAQLREQVALLKELRNLA